MSLETAQFIHQLNPSNPSGSDRLKQGDDHLRLLKAALQATFPSIKGEVEVSHEFLNTLKDHLVPTGTITLFSGETAPAGWAICNGTTYAKADGTGTITSPDLRNRVAIGASADLELLSTSGAAERTVTSEVAGKHAHTASTSEAGAHEHTVSGAIGSSKTGITAAGVSSTTDAGSSASNVLRAPITVTDPGHTHSLDGAKATSAGVHKHDVTIAEEDGHSHSVKVDVRQPSVALHYIIKL